VADITMDGRRDHPSVTRVHLAVPEDRVLKTSNVAASTVCSFVIVVYTTCSIWPHHGEKRVRLHPFFTSVDGVRRLRRQEYRKIAVGVLVIASIRRSVQPLGGQAEQQ